MKDARPGHVSSLAACIVAGMAIGAFAADLPKRTPVPFVVDPFNTFDEQPLMIGKPTALDWQSAQAATPRFSRPVYQSFDFVCRRDQSVCPADDEVHCDVRIFGKPAQENGKSVLLSEWVTSQGCERLDDLRPHKTGMHSSVRFDGPGFVTSGPEMFKDFLLLGSTSP
ncbi:hypothetical protein LJR090_002334 [Bosea sp. LjRoot90]|uniref:hypothetical protein n=1 Tax=Bosea sp. LjRoot90 TaxID=3342342 RepID=UPI003ECEC5BF